MVSSISKMVRGPQPGDDLQSFVKFGGTRGRVARFAKRGKVALAVARSHDRDRASSRKLVKIGKAARHEPRTIARQRRYQRAKLDVRRVKRDGCQGDPDVDRRLIA